MLIAIQKKFSPVIERSLKKIVLDLKKQKAPLALTQMIAYHFQTGGKRLRPICVFLAGKPTQYFLPLALAVEVIHNATLIHDDLQDEDKFRRGKATLWHKFSPAQAINCGDYLFFYAFALIQNSNYPAQEKQKIMQLFTKQTMQVIAGQSEEFALKSQLKKIKLFPKEEHYIRLVQAKTSALFTMPILGAAYLLGLNEKSCTKIKKSCNILGIAFQIKDDYLDLWGNKGRDKIGSDIGEGKLSFPVILAAQELKKQNRHNDLHKLRNILIKNRLHTTDKDIQWAIMLFENLKIPEKIKIKMKSLEQDISKTEILREAFLQLFKLIQIQ